MRRTITDHIVLLLRENNQGLSRTALVDMAESVMKSNHWQNDVSSLLDTRLSMSPNLSKIAIKALSLGINKLIEFLNSPEHLAVMAVLDEAERKYGSRAKARRAMRKRFGGIGWRRKIRKAVSNAKKK